MEESKQISHQVSTTNNHRVCLLRNASSEANKYKFSGSDTGTQQSESQKNVQLPSILKKPQQLPSSSQSSTLILQPNTHLNQDVPIELSNFKFSMNKCSTLPRPPPPPRIPKSPDQISGTSIYQNYKITGTLDRKHIHAKDFEDLRV